MINLITAKEESIHYFQGDTLPLTILVKDDQGADYDFAGCAATMKIRRDHDDTGQLLELSTTNSKITLASGTLTILESAANMAAAELKDGTYYYDLILTLNDGTVQTWLYGKFVVKQKATL